MTDKPACPVCERPYGADEATCPECGWELQGSYELVPDTAEVRLRYERDLAQKRLAYRERQFQRTQARLEATVQRDQDRLAALEASLAALEADLSRERDQAQTQIAALKADLSREREQTQTQIAALKANLSREREQTQTQIAALKADLSRERDQAQTQIRELNKQLEQVGSERARLSNRSSSESHPQVVRLRTRVRRLTMILLALSGIFLAFLIAIWLTDGNFSHVTSLGRSEPSHTSPTTSNPTPTAITVDNPIKVVQRVRLGKGGVSEITWTPDGTRLAVASLVGVFLYDTSTIEEVRYIATDSPVQSIAFAPDGATLAAGSQDATRRMWRVADGALMGKRTGHTGWVNSVALAPDGATLVSGSNDGTVRLWSIGSIDGPYWNLERTLKWHTGAVNSVALAPDGVTLASGSSDTTVWLWRVVEKWWPQMGKDDKAVRHMKGHTGAVMSVAFAPDGLTLASASQDETVRVWGGTDGKPLRTLKGHTGWVNSVAFAPDGQTLASGSHDGTVRLWRVADGTLLHTLEGHTGAVMSVAFAPDGATLASGSDDGNVYLWGLRE